MLSKNDSTPISESSKTSQSQAKIEESKITSSLISGIGKISRTFLLNLLIFLHTENATPTLLAWCSAYSNKISIIELESKQDYASFDGLPTKDSSKISIFRFSSGL